MHEVSGDDTDALSDLPLGPVSAVGLATDATAAAEALRLFRRRADVDARQEFVAKILEETGCDGAVLLVPAHVNWFTGGLNVRGLFAESERPGIYTNGRQRWLLCSAADTQRIFDEELHELGFQVKEWQWGSGRAVLLGELITGKKFIVDRPFPNLPTINDRLRLELRVLSDHERDEYRRLGRRVAHALEATARTLQPGQSEEEIAGQVAHRLVHRGIDAASISVLADDRGRTYRRAGFTAAAVSRFCTIQATGMRAGLYCTAARSVCLGTCPDDLRTEFDAACRVSAVQRSLSIAGETIARAAEAGWTLLAGTEFEYEGRLSQPGYGTGRVPAEELRRAGQDEPFAPGWAVVWQARVGAAAIVDTMLVDRTPLVATPPEAWPFKRINVLGTAFDIPDILIRTS